MQREGEVGSLSLVTSSFVSEFRCDYEAALFLSCFTVVTEL